MTSNRFSITVRKNPEITIYTNELLDVSYGCYVWPSALVLASYLLNNKHLFTKKRVIELGCGVCIPGLLLCKFGASHVCFSDIISPYILEKNIRLIIELNGCTNSNFLPMNWGEFKKENMDQLKNFDLVIG